FVIEECWYQFHCDDRSRMEFLERGKSTMTTVMLQSSQPVLTAGFQAILSTLKEFTLTSVCSTADEVMQRILRERPNVVVMELSPALTLEAIGRVIGLSANAAVVLWIDDIAIELASQAISAGVRGLLRKSLSLELQAKCLVKVAAGEMWVEKSL